MSYARYLGQVLSTNSRLQNVVFVGKKCLFGWKWCTYSEVWKILAMGTHHPPQSVHICWEAPSTPSWKTRVSALVRCGRHNSCPMAEKNLSPKRYQLTFRDSKDSDHQLPTWGIGLKPRQWQPSLTTASLPWISDWPWALAIHGNTPP